MLHFNYSAFWLFSLLLWMLESVWVDFLDLNEHLQNIQQHRPCDLIGSAAGWWRNRPGPCVGHLGVGRPGHCTETGWKWPTGKRRKHKISNWYQNYICKNKFLWEEEIATFHWWISTSSKVDFFYFINLELKGQHHISFYG